MSAGTEAAGMVPARTRTAELRPPARVLASLHRLLATAILEVRLNLTVPAPWVIGLILAGLGYLTVRTAPDASSFPLAWALSTEVAPLAAALLLFLSANLANRPNRYEVTELLDSKLVASEELILGRWLGMVAAILAPVGLMFTATIVGQMIHSKSPVLPLAYEQSLLRMLPGLLFMTTLSFALVAITRVLHLGAGLAAILWFALYSGQEHYPTALRLDLSQNAPVLLGFTAAVLLGMLLGHRGKRRSKRAVMTTALAGATVLVFLGSAVYAVWLHLALPGKHTAVATWQRLPKSRLERARPVPNFAWLDNEGRRVSLAGLRGKPALLVFFGPKDGGLLPLLRRLAGLRTEIARDMAVVPICIAEDLGGAQQAITAAGVRLPVVTDWGLPAGDAFDERKPGSVAAWKLGISRTPTAMVLAEDGRQIPLELPLDEAGWDDLKTKVKAVISGEVTPDNVPGQETQQTPEAGA